MKTAIAALSLLAVGSATEQAPALRASLDRRPGVPAHFNEYAGCLQICGDDEEGCACVDKCIAEVESYGITIAEPEDVCDCVDDCSEAVAEGNMEAPACYRGARARPSSWRRSTRPPVIGILCGLAIDGDSGKCDKVELDKGGCIWNVGLDG